MSDFAENREVGQDPDEFPDLTPFQRSRLFDLNSFLVDGRVVDGMSPFADRWRKHLRMREAGDLARRVRQKFGAG